MDLNGGITEDDTGMDLSEAITKAYTNLNSKLGEHPKEKERSQPTIYRVHRHLRDVNSSAYEPEVISIGPYHRGKDHLKMMEDHKLLTLQLLVEREGIDIMELASVGGVALKARKYYADQDFELSESEFIEMLVLDGCFIIELVRMFGVPGLRKEAHPIFDMRWMVRTLQRDLMLFENQVPFFVLLKLFNLIHPLLGADLALVHLIFNFFSNFYPGSERLFSDIELRSEVALKGSQEMMHLLDLIHPNSLPQPQVSEEEHSDTHTIKFSDFEFMYCATRLTEANVKFEVNEKATSLFKIEFKDGTMVMPPLRIDDRTECLLRNLVVYEQYFKKSPHDFVSQYMKLLDGLIDSSKDVEILSGNGIIKNWQGDDEVVANMVNRLGDSITCGLFNYTELIDDVNEHCRKPKNRWMAKLRRDYLNSPWAIISILAAVVLLLLTVVQTVFTILQVVQ